MIIRQWTWRIRKKNEMKNEVEVKSTRRNFEHGRLENPKGYFKKDLLLPITHT